MQDFLDYYVYLSMEIYKKIKDRKNIILLWDSLWDHHMSDGFDYDNIINIWFLIKNTLYLWVMLKNNNNIDSTVNTELQKIHSWLKVNKLSLNMQKTKAMVFHVPK